MVPVVHMYLFVLHHFRKMNFGNWRSNRRRDRLHGQHFESERLTLRSRTRSRQSYYGVLSPKRSSDFMIKPRQTPGGGLPPTQPPQRALGPASAPAARLSPKTPPAAPPPVGNACGTWRDPVAPWRAQSHDSHWQELWWISPAVHVCWLQAGLHDAVCMDL